MRKLFEMTRCPTKISIELEIQLIIINIILTPHSSKHTKHYNYISLNIFSDKQSLSEPLKPEGVFYNARTFYGSSR